MSQNIEKIAIVGIAGRFPGSNNIKEFWENLLKGKETIKHFTDDELHEFEFEFEKLKNRADYVKARGVLNDIDKFDAGFFDYTPSEASILDPQHRIWLENVWHAFEDAGLDPFTYQGAIGVYAGGYSNTYLLNNILRNPEMLENYIRLRSAKSFQIMTGNNNSYIPTKTSFHFNLKGPAVNVQTACSTSLVAVSQACQSLLSYESDACLAGGVCLSIPQESGYIYQEGAIPSPDGHCRPFDIDGNGTVFSNGVGVVVLKRYEDAIKDKDRIYALISGWGLNNDGSNKVSFTAPSVDGQAEAILMAQSFADVSPEDICYIEAHGTATNLGDPIEIEGLTKAFSRKTNKKQYCGIGSLKSNIGHTDAAAGVASLIKVALSAYNRVIPASINYSKPNKHINFANTPFYVLSETKKWMHERPMIMGISSFGIGGTNAHVIVEEAPEVIKSERQKADRSILFPLSAKSKDSLNAIKDELAAYLGENKNLNLEDVSYTLFHRRHHFQYKSFMLFDSVENSILLEKDNFRTLDSSEITFVFPGQGAQYVSMGSDLYKREKLVKEIMDECFDIVREVSDINLKSIMFGENPDSKELLTRTDITQPALFVCEYAIARYLMSLGIKPGKLIGHSIGEYAAACIAGVFNMETALKIVLKRGALMNSMPEGTMLAVNTSYEKLSEFESTLFEIAANNADSMCTISYKSANHKRVLEFFEQNSILTRELNTSHAFHSADFDPIMDEFEKYIDEFDLKIPAISIISSLYGEDREAELCSGSYWAMQLRNTVQFNKGINSILDSGETIFIETGPNTHLSSLIKQNQRISNKLLILPTIGKPNESNENIRILNTIGKLWALGVDVDANLFCNCVDANFVDLPLYSFEKKRHWIDFNTALHYDKAVGFDEQTDIQFSARSGSESIEQIGKEFTLEESLQNILKELIGIENVGLDDDFYDLGGHSLIAIQAVTRIKEVFGVDLLLKTFLENPTISSLSKVINEQQDDSSEGGMNEKSTFIDYKAGIPLSPSQERLWVIAQIDNNAAYNTSLTYEFKGTLDIEIFRRSFDILFDRHKIFKTYFKNVEKVPLAYIDQDSKIILQTLDFTSFKKYELDSEIQMFLKNESRRKFDLEKGPLYRLFLIKTDENNYIFNFIIHHIIFDGWSWGVVTKELKEIYNSLLNQMKLELPPVKYDYFHYAVSASKQDADIKFKKAKDFWKEKLQNITGFLNLPIDYKRKAFTTGEGGKIEINLDKSLSEKIKSFCNEENVTIYMFLLSVYGILLHRYTNDEDICIGSPVANRHESRLEGLVGPFINTIVQRMAFDPNTNYLELLEKIKNYTLDALSYQDFPFELLVDMLQPERMLNTNPIYQVLFAWQNAPRPPLEIEGAKTKRVFQEQGVSVLDLTFYAWEEEGVINGEFEFNTDIFKRETIASFSDNLIYLVNVIISNPNVNVADLPVVSPDELHTLNSFNPSAVEIPDKPVHHLIEEMVQIYPQKPAVYGENGVSYTYMELNKMADKFAVYLVKNNFHIDGPIAVCLHRTPSMIVVLLGIMKAGGAYLPLDPSFPDARLNYMLEDSGAKLIVIDKSNKGRFIINDVTELCFDNIDFGSIATEKINTQEVNAKSLAYMIYTSGSSGNPKGVKIHHESLTNLINSLAKRPGITSEDKLLSVITLSFDMSVFEIFLPLANGASIYIATEKDVTDGRLLDKIINSEDITLLQATPQTWRLLIASGWKGKKSLRAITGGEALTSQLAQDLLSRVGELWNFYGPTETTVYSAGQRITDPDRILIGTPIDNTQIYILKNKSQQPIGALGEVCIGGVGVSDGYHNREELTRERFILWNGKYIYRTGDLGRFIDTGAIEVVGRNDNQIKHRGFRIEPSEIEFHLRQITGIKEAVVKLEEFGDNLERLVGFIQIDSNFIYTRDSLIEKLKKVLPNYMIPSLFPIVKEFPKTLNGKIDRKSLYVDLDEFVNSRDAESEDLEDNQKQILEIWEEILKLKNIRLTDNFFNIGGNSLLAISLVDKIKQQFNIELSLRLFFDDPTISAIVKNIEILTLSEMSKLDIEDNDELIQGEI